MKCLRNSSLFLCNTSVGQECGDQQNILLTLWCGRTQNYDVTNISLIPCNRVLLQKPMVPQLAKKLRRINFLLHKNFHLPILATGDTVPVILFYFLNIHFNITLPSTRRSSKWCLSVSLLHHNPVCIYLSPIHSTCSAHLNLLDLIIRITFCTQYQS